MSCQVVLSSIHSFLALCLAWTINTDLINLGSSLLRCLRTVCAAQERVHHPQVYKSTRIGSTLWAKGWPPPSLIPKLPFSVQANEYPFIGLFCISDLYLKDMYIQGEDTQGLLSALILMAVLARGGQVTFLIGNIASWFS